MEASLALYRRYRPDSFAEVIGQDHVTGPLRAALTHNRVNHAYLFSGPRGCGKTTSARILARCLNCEKGPTDEPCGVCRSCVDLARGGPGSIDVIEIDAASHGGVDDARDLRERAFFAPVASRYKVYIIDEAHMVTPQGFNALLKLVEEPPEHLKFIFATTEPDKVIGTIRSRTHHYPFRLIAPRILTDYLRELCTLEGVEVAAAALPLVVRAGGGSARDTLSVLDQLMGGAGEGGVTYELATGLLGYTPDNLLDEVVDAFAAGDGRTVFGVVDKVIETGQDPRRFTEDLLRRLRDLVIIAAVPDAPATGLIDVPQDQGERLTAQAARFGRADLTRSAELVADGLTELKGATAPRLLLELICARVLLPAADDGVEGVLARLDRIEKRMEIEGTPSADRPPAAARPSVRPAAVAAAAVDPGPARAPVPSGADRSEEADGAPRVGDQPDRAGQEPAASEHAASEPAAAEHAAPDHAAADHAAPDQAMPDRAAADEAVPGQAAAEHAMPDQASGAASRAASGSDEPAAGRLGLVDVRRLWPDLLDAVKLKRRYTWILLSQNAQVAAVDDVTLTVALVNAGARNSFTSGGSEEILRQAAIDVIGHAWRIETIVDPTAQPGAEPRMSVTRPSVEESTQAPAPTPTSAPTPAPTSAPAPTPTSAPASAPTAAPAPVRPAGGSPVATHDASPDEPADTGGTGAVGADLSGEAPAGQGRRADPSSVGRARGLIQDTRPAGGGSRSRRPQDGSDEGAHRDDADAEDHGLAGAQLLERELGASIIEEIQHD